MAKHAVRPYNPYLNIIMDCERLFYDHVIKGDDLFEDNSMLKIKRKRGYRLERLISLCNRKLPDEAKQSDEIKEILDYASRTQLEDWDKDYVITWFSIIPGYLNANYSQKEWPKIPSARKAVCENVYVLKNKDGLYLKVLDFADLKEGIEYNSLDLAFPFPAKSDANIFKGLLMQQNGASGITVEGPLDLESSYTHQDMTDLNYDILENVAVEFSEKVSDLLIRFHKDGTNCNREELIKHIFNEGVQLMSNSDIMKQRFHNESPNETTWIKDFFEAGLRSVERNLEDWEAFRQYGISNTTSNTDDVFYWYARCAIPHLPKIASLYEASKVSIRSPDINHFILTVFEIGKDLLNTDSDKRDMLSRMNPEGKEWHSNVIRVGCEEVSNKFNVDN